MVDGMVDGANDGMADADGVDDGISDGSGAVQLNAKENPERVPAGSKVTRNVKQPERSVEVMGPKVTRSPVSIAEVPK